MRSLTQAIAGKIPLKENDGSEVSRICIVKPIRDTINRPKVADADQLRNEESSSSGLSFSSFTKDFAHIG